jgi:DNA-binding LytR/AlgR family response regulator
MEKLPTQLFYRINRGNIINVQHISKIQTDKVMIGNLDFSVNKTIREILIEIMEKI